MSSQDEVKALVEKLETAVDTVITAAEQFTDEQWQTDIPDEGGSVGMVTHHIASGIAPIMDWAMKVAQGEELPPFTREALHQYNANHAQKHANPNQAETIVLLRENKAAAAQRLNSLNDAHLSQALPFALADGQEISTQQMVEWFIINHCHNHLKNIKEALEMV